MASEGRGKSACIAERAVKEKLKTHGKSKTLFCGKKLAES